MKTFLQILQDVWLETGLSGPGPIAVTGLDGISKRISGYVVQAWLDIQAYRNDWPWMFKEFSFNTSPGKQRYPCIELALTDVETWDFSGAAIYKTIDGKRSEIFLGSTTYRNWWNFHRIGEATPSQPESIFFDPATNDLMLFPVPDDEYTIALRYCRAAQRLAASGDIPLMPTNQAWQEIIKWKALIYYGYQDGAPDIIAEAETKYSEMIHALDNKKGQNISISVRPIA